MRDTFWRVGFTLTALTLLATLGPNISCGPGSRFIEQATGRTPQARIEDYFAAIAKGNRQAALALWSTGDSPNPQLETRRASITGVLLGYGPHPDYRILSIEWWRTCCEPGVIDDPDEAGGTRIHVAVRSPDKPEGFYVFDLLVPGGYWGAAAGYPVRQWVIVDVYPEGEKPLAWIRR